MAQEDKKLVNFLVERELIDRFDAVLKGQKRTPIIVNWIKKFVDEHENNENSPKQTGFFDS